MTALRKAEQAIGSAAGVRPAPPCVFDAVAALRLRLREARKAGMAIGLVPTMGALHEGHLSLIRAARQRCDLVVVSLFVNPTQFDEQADLAAYPRDHARDAVLASQAGADLLFAPAAEEIYRRGFATTVEVHGLTDRLEGAIRGSSHFRGVTTIVCKLLNIAAPDVAFFGQKDAQQAAVIRRMVADLDIDVQIETLPTVREPDGLAMSSRNARLTPSERERAVSLSLALRAAQRFLDAGERSSRRLIEAADAVLAQHEVSPEYVALVDPHSFLDLPEITRDGLMLIAARIGQTRLIDNGLLCISSDREQEVDDPDRGRQTDDLRQSKGAVIAACSA